MPAFPSVPHALSAESLGVVRAVVGAGMLAAPTTAARMFGTDAATARRVTWLTRMMGVRDGALGVGTLYAARTGRDLRPWLLASAASDAVDAVVLTGALRAGRLRGVLPAACALGAAGAAALGVALAARPTRRG